MLKLAFFVYLFTGLAGVFISEDEAFTSDEPELDPFDSVYAIFKDKVPICAGAAVAASTTIFIVTAAHCVNGVQPSRLDVILRNAHFDHKKALSVHQVTVHPYYMPPSKDYDIAILKIKVPDFFSSYEPSQQPYLNLTETEPLSNNPVLLVNWNLKAESNKLTTINGVVEDRKSCRIKLSNYISVSSKMLCANFQSDIVPYGGPLLFQGHLAGVASYNIKGSKGNLPVVFTNVANSEIYSFIKKYSKLSPLNR